MLIFAAELFRVSNSIKVNLCYPENNEYQGLQDLQSPLVAA